MNEPNTGRIAMDIGTLLILGRIIDLVCPGDPVALRVIKLMERGLLGESVLSELVAIQKEQRDARIVKTVAKVLLDAVDAEEPKPTEPADAG